MTNAKKPTTKAEWRHYLRQARKSLSVEQRQHETTATITALRLLLARNPNHPIASYVAMGSELDLLPLNRSIVDNGQSLLLPRVDSHDLICWHRITNLGDLRDGAHGTIEPDPSRTEQVNLPSHATVLVPGLGFGIHGQRLGQGKGYYDRALASHTGLTIGIGFACQRADDLPLEAHDRRLDGVFLGGIAYGLAP